MTEILENAARLITEVVKRRHSEPGRRLRPLGLLLLTGPESAEAIHIARILVESAFGNS